MAPTDRADKETTFRIGEAAELLGLETYVLRFWETEFPHLAPLRTPKGQRLYAERHMEQLRRVKFLLHEQGFTIEGARRVLEAEAAEGGTEAGTQVPQELCQSPCQSPCPSQCQGFLFAPQHGGVVQAASPANVRPTDMRPVETASEPTPPSPEATGLREALRSLHQELVDVRELLRSGRAGSSGDVS